MGEQGEILPRNGDRGCGSELERNEEVENLANRFELQTISNKRQADGPPVAIR
jgi:hypothetical protein